MLTNHTFPVPGQCTFESISLRTIVQSVYCDVQPCQLHYPFMQEVMEDSTSSLTQGVMTGA